MTRAKRNRQMRLCTMTRSLISDMRFRLSVHAGTRHLQEFELHWDMRVRRDTYLISVLAKKEGKSLEGCTGTDCSVDYGIHRSLHHCTPRATYKRAKGIWKQITVAISPPQRLLHAVVVAWIGAAIDETSASFLVRLLSTRLLSLATACKVHVRNRMKTSYVPRKDPIEIPRF